MKFLGILRASALFILLSAFHGSRGVFCSNLEVNPSAESPTVEVPEISENLEDSAVESSSASSAPAPKSDLVFESSEWDDSHLASTVLFLEQFCEGVKAKKFDAHIPDANIMKLSKATYAVSSYLELLTDSLLPRYGPGSVEERKEIPGDLYENALRPEKFKDYSKWIVKNIPNIDKALMNMYNDGLKLSKEQLKTNTEVGPLKYGFVYNGYWWSMSLGSGNCDMLTVVISEIQTFSGALESLQKRLGEILEDPQREKASTTRKFLSLFSRGKKSDVNPKQEDSTVKSQAVEDAEHKDA
ncbi:secreted antigen 1 [Babesia divergens]|uniref:Secreted antigen 1 n=1 Tax=Babesia divergens TaxID=32595 RepID=A0AAD9G6S6_BABDI|nr:secreted antigen 1 [Babesia divergens]